MLYRNPNNHPSRSIRPRRLPRTSLLETLESRQLLSGTFTAEEVYLAELINRARLDPAVEAARLGMDFSSGLNQGEIDLLGPVEPLALNSLLKTAARTHSLDMIERDFFDHINPDDLNPTQRARAAGYTGVAGEAIASAHNSVDALYEAWMDTPENRVSILSLFTAFNDSFHYDHIGPGFVLNHATAEDHFTAMFGDPGAGSTANLLGVVYADNDNDDFYSIGEGLANIRIEVASANNPDTTSYTFTTDQAGNYQLDVGPGSWIVTFTDIDTGWFVDKAVTVGQENVKLDASPDEFQAPPDDGNGDNDGGGDGGGGDGGGDNGDNNGGDNGGDGNNDDHADDGNYPDATALILNDQHHAESTGVVDTVTDTDLFYFTADTAGEVSIALDAANSQLIASLVLQSAAGLPLYLDAAQDAGGSVTLTWNVAEGAQYFLVVGADSQSTTGQYTLSVTITPPGDDGSGGGDDSGDGNNDNGDNNGNGGGDDGDNAPDDDNPPVDATSDQSGNLSVVRTDEQGRPILFMQQADGTWISLDLVGQAGGPTPQGRFSTFLDPATGRSSVISATDAGLALYSQDGEGLWSVRNLSAELRAAPIVSKPVNFTSRTGLVYTAGIDADGNLVTYRHTGDTDESDRPEWAFEDLSSDHLAPQGQQLEDLLGSTLIAYVTGWNALTIAGLDTSGRVRAAWWAPGLERWQSSDLSAITGAPQYQGAISAYLTPWNGINIAGTDVNGDLSVVWWVPSFGGQWQLTKLNRVLNGPDFVEGSIASWVTPWGGINISGLTEQGDVVVYWWTPDPGTWSTTTLSDYISEVEPPSSGVVGHTSNRGVITIVGLSDAGDLVRYWWEAGQPWRGENLSL